MGFLDRVEQSSLDRRKFLALSAAAAAATASASLVGCQPGVEEVPEEQLAEIDLEGGKWVPFTCMSDTCGGRCYNRAYVVDGIIKRHGTDNSHEDTEDNPQRRCCLKGFSTRTALTSADRLKYPMKRKNWMPGGGDNVNGHLRGIDEWERISWDQAIDYIVEEITRIRDTYGNKALLGMGLGDYKSSCPTFFLGSAVLNLFGGCLTTWGQASNGPISCVLPMMRGYYGNGAKDSQDRMALRHAKLMVLWGYNPAWSAGGSQIYDHIVARKKSGMKVIAVDPYFHPTAQALADEWVPCRPGTDAALLEAIAYVMIENNWQDQEFLDKCCVGFDAEHMPADAKVNENFKDYILGAYDGQPKTPEWASAICGASPAAIRGLAEQMATTKPMALKAGMAPSRTSAGERFVQLFFTVGWMTGNVGKLGGEVTIAGGTPGSHFGYAANPVNLGRTGFSAFPANATCTEPRTSSQVSTGNMNPEAEYGLPYAELFKSIVEGEYVAPGTDEKKPCDIRCMYRDTGFNLFNQGTGGEYAIEAYRKVDFVCVHDFMFSPDAQYADIVLPVTTGLECDFSSCGMNMNDYFQVGTKVIEPYFESKADIEIVTMIADRIGAGEDVLTRQSPKQAMFNKLQGATVMLADGSDYEPLVAITQEDLDKWEVVGQVQEGRVALEDLLQTGCYQFERSEDDAFVNCYDKAFCSDPEANPVATTSGKYEIYSQRTADYYNSIGFSTMEPLPKYKPALNGYEQAQADPEYPFQLVTAHHICHSHSTFSNCKQVKELYANDLLMCAYDADKLGLSHGDWVLASSKTGKIVRKLAVIPNIMPGVVLIGQGNWRRMDDASGIDFGGNVNTLTTSLMLGDGFQAYNSVLLKIEKWDGEGAELDYLMDTAAPEIA